MLLEAVRHNHPIIVELLLENGADYTARLNTPSENYTAIGLAIRLGNKRIVQLFLNKITHPVKEAVQVKRMILSSAVAFQTTEVAQMVFEKDPSLGLKGKYGRKLLLIAVQNGDHETIEILLEKGASPDRKDIAGREQLLSEAELFDKEWLGQKLDFYLNTA